MRAQELGDLLQKGDRVAVSNITGREASGVSVTSQLYGGNIVGGWALGKGGQKIATAKGDIPVFADCAGLMKNLPPDQRPNKVIIYSPPSAVYGEVKEVISYGASSIETIFIITEHVSVEVTAKIRILAQDANIDVVGCNTLGVINTHDHVRVGAVGGNEPEESFRPGSATIMSNSGNMVNTIASSLLTAGIGTSFGISTGKDVLILTRLADLLPMAEKDPRTKVVVLYVEPGGLYEQEALKLAALGKFTKPIVVYVGGRNLDGRNIALGHAGAVVEGAGTSAQAKADAFDAYFGVEPFDPGRRYRKSADLAESLGRGIRVRALHDIPAAVQMLYRVRGYDRDLPMKGKMDLNPWFVNYAGNEKRLPSHLALTRGEAPEPWASQITRLTTSDLGAQPPKRNMRNHSNASFNDGRSQRIYGRPVNDLMAKRSFAESLILYWTGEEATHDFEPRLVEMCLIASLTNGPGTLSAQGAKLSASAGNMPHTAMIATLATIGEDHGGNGRRAVEFLTDIFRTTDMQNPYDAEHDLGLKKIAIDYARAFKKVKAAAKDTGVEYQRIPCLGHPVFNTQAVNYDPRERAIHDHLQQIGVYNIFLDFYHHLAQALRDVGVASKVWAVNVDAAIACVWLGICWPKLRAQRITFKRTRDLAFLGFALGRAAGGAGEFLDHRDYGSPLDMRVPPADVSGPETTKPVD